MGRVVATVSRYQDHDSRHVRDTMQDHDVAIVQIVLKQWAKLAFHVNEGDK